MKPHAAFPCPWCGEEIPAGKGAACKACGEPLLVAKTYRITGHVARSVWRAEHTRDKTHVAVKILAPPENDDWTAWELFERSCKVLEQLHHRALPKVHAFERTEKGHLVLVREDFDGGTLEERIKERDERLSRSQATKLLRQLLELLAYLQDRVPPVIHRDIKPSNIMFRGKASWEPVLVDFDTVVSRRTGLTLVGTPGYAPPEQFAAEAVPASDVYGVGTTMLFVATHTEPDDLPRKDGRFELDGKLGDELAAILPRMVEPDLSKRYAKAKEVLRDLDAPSRVPTKKKEPEESAKKKSGAGRYVLIVGALVAVAVGKAAVGDRARDMRIEEKKNAPLVTADTRCRSGITSACYDLAGWYAKGKNGAPKDLAKAATYYDLGCQRGAVDCCNNLGVAYGKGEGVPKDLAKSAAAYDTACSGKNPLACRNLAWLYKNGEGVPKDLGKALALRNRACDLGDGEGCTQVGLMHENGEGTAKDEKTAARFYGLACDHDNAWGCRDQGLLFRDGRGVEKDDRRAATLFKRACDAKALDSDACYHLGRMVAAGRGVEVDTNRAAQLYDKACKNGSAWGCDALGDAIRKEDVVASPTRAAELYAQACDGGVAAACAK